ncbi:oligosaccharide flippase family protein [Duganella sp. FT94W]|uniref:Oligosaccharide flippase family protein n=1 Tax=Duganella lactea TaxID=2692173 RepID=A0ABW9V935_9BURK|nr:flippase [Duganella lactea]MYM36171.1 oligosaccharide flippase family protein [Duganella lactea]
MKKINLEFIKNNDGKRLVKDFFFIFSVNVTTFIFPLITFPYLVRTLGISKFGLLAFATSITAYFLILVDYGFNLTATRAISINRDAKEKVDEIFSAVMTIKIIIIFLGLGILLLAIYLVPKLNEYWYVFLLSYGNVVGQALFPMWLFQGIEKMKIGSTLNIVSKTVFTILIFTMVHKESDFYLVPILSASGFILAGIISLLLVKFKFEISYSRQPVATLTKYIIDGWSIFLSNISVTLYTTATITFLGFFTTIENVGYYSVADRIISAVRGIMSPLSQVLFPFLCKKAKNDKKQALAINRKLYRAGGFLMLIASACIFIFAKEIIFLIFNKADSSSVSVLRIMSIIPFLTFLHSVFALLTMIAFGRNAEYSKIILSAAILNTLLCIILIPVFDFKGAAIAVVLVEAYLLFRYIYFTEKNDLKVL